MGKCETQITWIQTYKREDQKDDKWRFFVKKVITKSVTNNGVFELLSLSQWSEICKSYITLGCIVSITYEFSRLGGHQGP